MYLRIPHVLVQAHPAVVAHRELILLHWISTPFYSAPVQSCTEYHPPQHRKQNTVPKRFLEKELRVNAAGLHSMNLQKGLVTRGGVEGPLRETSYRSLSAFPWGQHRVKGSWWLRTQFWGVLPATSRPTLGSRARLKDREWRQLARCQAVVSIQNYLPNDQAQAKGGASGNTSLLANFSTNKIAFLPPSECPDTLKSSRVEGRPVKESQAALRVLQKAAQPTTVVGQVKGIHKENQTNKNKELNVQSSKIPTRITFAPLLWPVVTFAR